MSVAVAAPQPRAARSGEGTIPTPCDAHRLATEPGPLSGYRSSGCADAPRQLEWRPVTDPTLVRRFLQVLRWNQVAAFGYIQALRMATAVEQTRITSATKTRAEPGTGQRARGSAPTDSWALLADCESSGDWGANTGNGFEGGLQFTPSTYRAYGGTGHAYDASPAEQIAVAERVLAAQGPGAWPVCSYRAGMR